jgi:hypothetical protein
LNKYKVISEIWYKKHNKIYKVGEEIELTEKEAQTLGDAVKQINIYETKPLKNYLTKKW